MHVHGYCRPFLRMGKRIIGYREALTLDHRPASLLVVGSRAIGSELAWFYNARWGLKVTPVEFMPYDPATVETWEYLTRWDARSRKPVSVLVKSTVESIDTSGELLKINIRNKKDQIETCEAEMVLSAVGIAPNVEKHRVGRTGYRNGKKYN